MNYADRLEQQVKDRIVNDLKDHEVKALHVSGLYRHYRCQKPGTGNMCFDAVTWPGSLCYTGDMGEFLFQRTDDMISFVRDSCMSYCYMAEKCEAAGSPIKEWRQERFEEVLDERLKESEENEEFQSETLGKESHKKKVADEIEDLRHYDEEHAATSAMYDSDLWDGSDLPSCEEYTYRFLWCLHALKWFCEKVLEVSPQ